MELSTTNTTMYKRFEVKPREKKTVSAEKFDAPVAKMSSYAANFPNWRNGSKDIYHEKTPQYPVYSLPFSGNTAY